MGQISEKLDYAKKAQTFKKLPQGRKGCKYRNIEVWGENVNSIQHDYHMIRTQTKLSKKVIIFSLSLTHTYTHAHICVYRHTHTWGGSCCDS